MRSLPLVVFSLVALACRADGTTTYVPDRDDDGVNEGLDCDDNDPTVGAGTTYYYDGDLDGHGDAGSADSFCKRPEGYAEVGDDCDDTNAAVFPGAEDVCDKLDNDCDGIVDNGLASTAWYTDVDGDGYGADDSVLYDCTQPEGVVELGGDCDDGDIAYNPGAIEEDCEDPNDYNCDGFVGFTDNDGDGFAACAECDDGNAQANPVAVEICNGADDDCDALVDDEDDSLDVTSGVTVYPDLDGDGFGDPASPAEACEPGPGWVADASDCDDARADVNPTATEVCNGLDDDCDTLVDDLDESLDTTTGGAWYGDADGDGYGDDGIVTQSCDAPSGAVALAGDCDDADPAYNPGATEADCTDPNDYNCDGSVGYADGDGDGYAACEECDDANAANFPGATELCDGADNDCDGSVDEDDAADAATWYVDADGDTFGDPALASAACTQPAGSVADATDCDDSSAAVNPAQTELCNAVDDNCDGSVDEATAADAATWYADGDGDSYGDSGSSLASCAAPSGYVSDATDCDDADATINPGALELCDGVDNNCDGNIDEDASVDVASWYADSDGDTYGDAGTMVLDCNQPAGYVADETDCDDTAGTVHPGATESCNSIDDDCDGTVDEAVTTTYYADSDADGYGDTVAPTAACAAPAGYVLDATDCDDSVATVHPGATELCNSVDDDCDGTADDGVTTTYYADSDADSYGDVTSTTAACSAPAGYVSDATDCDDGSGSVHPGATELCNSIDDDCDGTIDDGATTTYYADTDTDGYGDALSTTAACSLPSGYSALSTDCDDTRAAVHPLATEACNGYDDDCDGSIDEAGSTGETTWYADTDGDGYGDSVVTSNSCSAPAGYVASSTDCDDGDIDINPSEIDACDTIDNDCDGSKDNGGYCPCSVDEDGGHVYMFCTTAATESAAETACLTYGYDLVALNDAAENTWVVDTAYTFSTGKWWTGYSDAVTEGTWLWSNGDTSTYTNWHASEPNNSNGNENCMQLGRFSDYTWNDEPCATPFAYVCEE